MRRWRRNRLPVLLLLASYAIAAVAVALGYDSRVSDNFRRSIDLGGTSDNYIANDDEISSLHQRRQQHLHQTVPGKPSKLDLDVSQLTETDDKAIHELDKKKLQQVERPETEKNQESETTTLATQANNNNERNQEEKIVIKCDDRIVSVKCVEMRIKSFLRTVSTVDTLNVTDSVQITKRRQHDDEEKNRRQFNATNDKKSIGSYKLIGSTSSLVDDIRRFARDHVLEIKLSKNAPREARTFFGAFGIKKLLLPLFVGVQIIKSILIALFLPSIIGSIGKIVGKGVTSFAQSSQNPAQQIEENYEFKDNQELYGDDYMQRQPLGTLPASAMYDDNMLQAQPSNNQQQQEQQQTTGNKEIASRFAFVDPRLTAAQTLSDRYYTRHVVNPQAKKQDFKIFHEIPTSSLLLTNYDPFYSPLLSRLDAVFSRLGYNSEGCREYAVCAMYRSPARYAPYSNLVSAQLSRELNELRKPSSDNPDVLRFFRYMKAAKDGQDGYKCRNAYNNCDGARDDQTIKQNQAMLATYQDIDKLVHARKL